ncbi:type II secretion system protein GspC [Parendozoicomonas haliclonae]|uniref:Type II secretion system protein C n=1 Tax=Parendozoicomonas haliclonae TaxID=1960125 RepID=A0A1X7AG95_9GAMM|nr:type II secretion system protein GspC [Parendozoicomonas haliclonae]SMA39465.1 Type II secretion system protein C [Parendozoicomonas haliclonae]
MPTKGTLFAFRAPLTNLIFVIEVVLVLLFAQQAAKFIWSLVPAPIVAAPRWQVENPARTSGNTPRYIALSGLEAFGAYLPAQTQQSRPTQRIPTSRINARITGLMVSSHPEHSLAIISEGSQQNAFRIGDKLKSSRATLVAIQHDRVIIDVSGRQEALIFAGATRPKAKTSRVAAIPQKPAQPVSPKLAEIVRSDPQSLMEMIRISPVRRDGQLIGYRVNAGNRPDLFKAAGLQNGDIATAINDTDLTNQVEALALMQSLPTLQTISLSVERQGQNYQIDLSL